MGEAIQLIQVQQYLGARGIGRFYSAPRQLVGGALWHSFDHNRGYHPDPFYGGIMDIFRQPKYTYYGFQSMRDPNLKVPNIDNGPMVFIANEMTPFSGTDVYVFTNCEEVRLSSFGKEFKTIKVKDLGINMPHPIVKFEEAYSWSELMRSGRSQNANADKIVVEGLIGGKVVATATKSASKREIRLVLEVDTSGIPIIANGSDIVTVIAKIIDQNGNVKRMAEEEIVFEVSGEGSMIAANEPWANPRRVEFGTAACLVQSSIKTGKITVRAHTLFEGGNTALPDIITFESVPSSVPLLFTEIGSNQSSEKSKKEIGNTENDKIRELQFERNQNKIKAVQEQQTKFENSIK